MATDNTIDYPTEMPAETDTTLEAPLEPVTDTPADPDTDNSADTPELQALAKTRREAANLRKRLRELEDTHATLQSSLDAAHWQMLTDRLDRSTARFSAEQLQKLGVTLEDYRNDDGTLNHDGFKTAVRDLASELGLLNRGPVIPRAGYHPTPPSANSYIDAFKAPSE